MNCATLKQLYQISQSQPGWLSTSDVVRLACNDCTDLEVCASINDSEYQSRYASVELATANSRRGQYVKN